MERDITEIEASLDLLAFFSTVQLQAHHFMKTGTFSNLP